MTITPPAFKLLLRAIFEGLRVIGGRVLKSQMRNSEQLEYRPSVDFFSHILLEQLNAFLLGLQLGKIILASPLQGLSTEINA